NYFVFGSNLDAARLRWTGIGRRYRFSKQLRRFDRWRLTEAVNQEAGDYNGGCGRRPLAKRSSQTLARAALFKLSVNLVEGAVDVSPGRGWRWQMILEHALAVADTFADGLLQFFELGAALPASFEVRTDLLRAAGWSFAVRIAQQF